MGMLRRSSMMASTSTAALSGSDGRADRRARMLAALAEYCRQEVRRAVGDQVLLGEVGCRGDEDGDLHHAGDSFESAERRLGLRQDVDRAELCRFACRPPSVEVAAERPAGDCSLPSFSGNCRR